MRIRILEQFLAFVRGFDDVWWATGRDICQWVEAAEATGDRRSKTMDSVAG